MNLQKSETQDLAMLYKLFPESDKNYLVKTYQDHNCNVMDTIKQMLNQKNKGYNGVPSDFSHPQNLKRKLSPDTEREISRKVQKQSSHVKPKQTNVPKDYPTHPYYNIPIQGNPLSTGHLYGKSNFNQNYALMAQQQIAAMHAAIQGNSHQIRRGFPSNFPATRINYLKASSFNGGKIPFNIAPFMAT